MLGFKVGVLALSASLTLGIPPLEATNSVGDQAVETLISHIEELNEQGAQIEIRPDMDVADLVDKNIELDSDDGETKPITVENFQTADYSGTVSLYPDGSVSIISIEEPQDVTDAIVMAAPAGSMSRAVLRTGTSISGCTALSTKDGWQRRQNCLVKYDSIAFKFAFKASYSVKSGGGRIDSYSTVRDSYVNRVPGRHFEDMGTYLGRRTNSGKSPAYAVGWVRTSIAGTTSTRYLAINVYGSAWTTNWLKQ